MTRPEHPYLIQEVRLDELGLQSGESDVNANGIVAFEDTMIDNCIVVIDTISSRILSKFSTDLGVSLLRITPDDKRIVIVDDQDNTTIWDATVPYSGYGPLPGKKLLNLGTQQNRVCDACISNDGKKLLLETGNDHVMVMDMNSGALITVFGSYGLTITCAAISSDGKSAMACVNCDGVIRFDTDTGAIISKYPIKQDVTEIWSTRERSKFIMMERGKSKAFVWNADKDASSNVRIDAGSSDSSYHKKVASSPCGTVFASIENSTTLVFTLLGHTTRIIDQDIGMINCLSFSEDGKKIFVVCEDNIRVYANIFPFWTIGIHRTFCDRIKKCIRLFFIYHMTNNGSRKRKRTYSNRLPKEIILHIFSFIRHSN